MVTGIGAYHGHSWLRATHARHQMHDATNVPSWYITMTSHLVDQGAMFYELNAQRSVESINIALSMMVLSHMQAIGICKCKKGCQQSGTVRLPSLFLDAIKSTWSFTNLQLYTKLDSCQLLIDSFKEGMKKPVLLFSWWYKLRPAVHESNVTWSYHMETSFHLTATFLLSLRDEEATASYRNDIEHPSVWILCVLVQHGPFCTAPNREFSLVRYHWEKSRHTHE